DLVATSDEFLRASWAAAATGGQAPIDLDPASFRELDQVRDISAEHGHAWWSIGPFGLDIDSGIHRADLEPAPLYRGDTDAALTDVNTWRHAGRAVQFVAPADGQARRAVEWFSENDVPAAIGEPVHGGVEVLIGYFRQGLDSHEHYTEIGRFATMNYDLLSTTHTCDINHAVI